MTPRRDAIGKIVLYGSDNSYFSDMADSATRAGYEIVAGIVVRDTGIGQSGIPAVITPDEITARLLAYPVAVVRIVPGSRKRRVEEARRHGFATFARIIDPTSVWSQSNALGRGLYVNAMTVIASRAELADFVFVGRQSSIGHHTRLEDYCTVGPGVTIASNCHLGRGTFIGAGATVAPDLVIGPNSVVGAGATVIRNVPANTAVAGNPARVIREGIKGYMDVEV